MTSLLYLYDKSVIPEHMIYHMLTAKIPKISLGL